MRNHAKCNVPHQYDAIGRLQIFNSTPSWCYCSDSIVVDIDNDSIVIVLVGRHSADPNIISLLKKVGFAKFILNKQA